MRYIPPLLLILLALLTLRSGVAEPADLYSPATRLIQDRYLYPENLRSSAMLEGAARQLTDKVEWLMADVEGNRVLLSDGAGNRLGEVEVGDLRDLPRALRAMEVLVAEAGHPIAPDTQLDVEILRGVISTLDRPSALLAGRRLESFNERLKGTLSGIGARIGMEEGEVIVRSVFPGAPADMGGVHAGDVVLRVDGISTLGMSVTDATDRIRGPADTRVVLQVRRGSKTLSLPLVRAEVRIPNLEHRVLSSGAGYISISHFSEHTVENLRVALAELASAGALEKGLVLDLRSNTGGSMIQAARAADQFLVEGRLVRTVGRDGSPVSNLIRQMNADDEGTEPPVPIAVLTDRRTASGSEILAGSLVLLDRAVIVGQRSYGKGTVQKIFNLRADVRMKLTVAEYLLVDDYAVADQGLPPDLPTSLVIFDHLGVREGVVPSEERDQTVIFVDERTGWRDDDSRSPRAGEDLELKLAERVVLEARGDSREELLAAARLVGSQVMMEEDQRLVDTFALAEIDWSPAPEPGPEPDVVLELHTDGPLRAGEMVTLRATVANNGDTPLYRARVRVGSENRTWDRMMLPIGHIPAGATGEGRRLLRLPARHASRLDKVSLTLDAHHRPSPPPALHHLQVTGRDHPHLAIKGSLQTAPDSSLVVLDITNDGPEDLHGLRVRFDFPAHMEMELLDREAVVASLPAHGRHTTHLALRIQDGAFPETLPLTLLVDAENWGRIVNWEFPLSVDGSPVSRSAPRLRLETVASGAAGSEAEVVMKASDEGVLDHAVFYVNGKKMRYVRGSGRRLEARLPLVLSPGTNRVAVLVEDDHGLRTRRFAYLLGEGDFTPALADEVDEDDP